MFQRNKAFTLIEVTWAILLFSLITTGFVATLIASTRAASNLPIEVTADSLAMKIIEEMQLRNRLNISEYDKLGDPEAPSEDSFLETFTFETDPDDPSKSVTINVDVEFKGFGMVSSAGSTSLTADFPDGFEEWETDEWAGGVVMIKKGRGSGQLAHIVSNTEDTLTITRNLDGTPGSSWIINPSTSSYFEINGGKTADVTARWSHLGKERSRTFHTLIYHP